MNGNGTKEGVGISLDREVLKVVDQKRNYETRSSFINRTLRTALGLSES